MKTSDFGLLPDIAGFFMAVEVGKRYIRKKISEFTSNVKASQLRASDSWHLLVIVGFHIDYLYDQK